MTSSLDPWRTRCGDVMCGGWSDGVGCGAVAVVTLAAGCPMLYTGYVEREEAVREACRSLDNGITAARPAGHRSAPRWLAVLSSAALPTHGGRKTLRRPVSANLCPRHVEEGIRFIRHSYPLEDVGVAGSEESPTMAVRVNTAVAAATVVPGTSIELELPVSHCLEDPKRLFGIPDVELDALAGRTGEVWGGGPGPPRPTAAPPSSLPTSNDHLGNVLD